MKGRVFALIAEQLDFRRNSKYYEYADRIRKSISFIDVLIHLRI